VQKCYAVKLVSECLHLCLPPLLCMNCQPSAARLHQELIRACLGGGCSHFLWKKLREITEVYNYNVILCFKWYGVVEIACYPVFNVLFSFIILLIMSQSAKTRVKRVSFRMPGKN